MSTPRDPHGETDRGHRAAGGQGDAAGPDPSSGSGRVDEHGPEHGAHRGPGHGSDRGSDHASDYGSDRGSDRGSDHASDYGSANFGGERDVDPADRTVPHTGRSGWDFTGTPEADPPTPAYGSPAVDARADGTSRSGADHESTPAHGWPSEGGAAPRTGDPAAGGSEWSAAGSGQSGWSSGGHGEGWDPADTAAWDPEGTTAHGGSAWAPEGDRTAAHPAPAGGWDPAGAGLAGATSATSTLPRGEGRAARRRGRPGGRRTLIAVAAAVVVVLAVLAVTAFWKPGFLVTEEFDQQALQAGVTQVLTQDYGLGATGVSCPEGQKVEAGTTFTCSANVDGENVEVPVTVLDDQGTYQVGRV